MKMRFTVLLWVLLVTGCAKDPVVDTTPGTAILVFGDSLSAGYDINEATTWVRRLETRLRDQKLLLPGQTMANESVSGETSAGGLERLPDALAEHSPRIVLIELGANDALRRQSMADLADNLEAMIALSEEAGAEVALVAVELPAIARLGGGSRLEDVYAQVAAKTGVPIILYPLADLVGNKKMVLPDRLHPSDAAQAFLAEAMEPGVADLLQE